MDIDFQYIIFLLENKKSLLYISILLNIIFVVLLCFSIVKLSNLLKTIHLLKKNQEILEKNDRTMELLEKMQKLTQIVGGINHELSPWIGSIKNKSLLVSKKITSFLETYHQTKYEYSNNHQVCIGFQNEQKMFEYCLEKMNEIYLSSQSLSFVINEMSKDIKRIQTYHLIYSNLGDTVDSWVRIVLKDLDIKTNIDNHTINVDKQSLNFSCYHSPMFVSQIILNLMKNSIEHNMDRLDTLRIYIYGNKLSTCLIYEDNGKGIPKHQVKHLFTPGFTTKDKHNEVGFHGIGLSLCREYCVSMKAHICLDESFDKGARFLIYFSQRENTRYNQ